MEMIKFVSSNLYVDDEYVVMLMLGVYVSFLLC